MKAEAAQETQSPIRWGGGIVEGSNGKRGLQHGVGSPWRKRWRWREKEKAGVVSPSGGWKGPSIPKTLLMVPLLLKNSERLKSCVQKKKIVFLFTSNRKGRLSVESDHW